MTVVLDCNILVICLTSRSPFHNIFQAMVAGKFQLAVTTEIMLEYEEIIGIKYGSETATAFVALLSELPNVQQIAIYYKWHLIMADPDDNKYCDCAIAGQADYIVTEDKHFDVLRKVPFPASTPVSIDAFAALLQLLT